MRGNQQMKNVLKIVSISDLHLGVLDPKYMYEQLSQQFLSRIASLDFDVLAICGDYFDSKFMSNNPIITYSLQLMEDIVNLCRIKQATLLMIYGTESHDSGQLSLFYHYLGDPTIDMRIVENIRFEEIKGMRVLCIPEKYGVSEEEYRKVLFESGSYDMCFLHGTLKGSVYGAEMENLNSTHAPVFSINSFQNCMGPIICGHIHVAGCFSEYMYYNGSPLRFRFGEEQEKGFLITLYNRMSRMHHTELVPIDSYIYRTITIDHLLNEDPKTIIEYIKHEKEVNHIDYIRVQFSNANENMNVVRNYFRTIGNVKLDETNKKEQRTQEVDQAVLNRINEYSYILDNEISEYDKFIQYVNQNEGYEFITSEELINLLEGDF